MIFVTGGTGIVGARVLFDLTMAGNKVRALRRASSNDDILRMVFRGMEHLMGNIEWKEGDVADVVDVEEALKGVAEVYHCAAKVSFHGDDRRELMRVNVGGTANMVNCALDSGVKKFCHVSSIAALGRVEEGKMMDENVFWKASKYNSAYAISKYGAEREVWRGMEEGLNAVIVSPSIIIGPGNWRTGSSAMFRQVWNGMKYYSEGVNGFVDVRDVSKSMLALMQKNIAGERFIVSSENCSYREIFNWIADSFHKPRPAIKVNKMLSEIGWRAEALRSSLIQKAPFITKETARNSQLKWYYSNEKIKESLGINFIPVQKSIEDCAGIFTSTISSANASLSG